MKLVLDTHIWIHAVLEPNKLSPAVRAALSAPENELLLSVVSIWETLTLAAKRRLLIEGSATDWVTNRLRGSPVKVVALTQEIVIAAHNLELVHKDPADRWIVATAQCHGAALATADRLLIAAKSIDSMLV
jgi:PIN domain nuclease of toxin-antitoxin system